jgi:penicillin amidase
MGRGFTPLLPLTTFTADRMSNLLKRLRGQPEGWFADGWRSEMLASLADIVRRLRAERGPVPSSWRWGDLRPLMLEHPVGAVGALAPIFNRGPFPWGGDGGTVSQAGTPVLNPLANPNPIASVRAVIDVGEWENSRFVLPGGQSGNPFSPHYDDLLPLWLQGEGVAIAWSSEAVAAARKHTLKLMPLRHRSSLD